MASISGFNRGTSSLGGLSSSGLTGSSFVPSLSGASTSGFGTLGKTSFSIPTASDLAKQFFDIFPQADPNSPQTFPFLEQAKQIVQTQLPQAPQIRPPSIPQTQIAFPEGGFDQLRDSLIQSQFQPIQTELQRQQDAATEQLQASLAARGLAESGVAVGQEQSLIDNFGRQQTQALSQAVASGTATALQAQLAVATQQASMDQQRALTEAQLDFSAQQQNAENILRRGAIATDALTRALALDVDSINRLRDSFVQFFSAATQAQLQASSITRQAMADIFGFILGREDLKLRTQQIAQQAQPQVQQVQPQQFELPSAFAVGLPGTLAAGGTVPNVSPTQFALASGIQPAPQVSGGGGGSSVGGLAGQAQQLVDLSKSLGIPVAPGDPGITQSGFSIGGR